MRGADPGVRGGPGAGARFGPRNRIKVRPWNPTGPRFDLGVQPETNIRNNSQQFAAIHSYSQIFVTKRCSNIRIYSQRFATKVNGNFRSCSQIFANFRNYSYLCSNIQKYLQLFAAIRRYSLTWKICLRCRRMPMPAIAKSRNPEIAKSRNRAIMESRNCGIAKLRYCRIAKSREKIAVSRIGIGNRNRKHATAA